MALVEPTFIDTDAATILAELVTDYETRTGRTLQPAQPERLVINMIAYREALMRQKFQAAGLMNLVTWSFGVALDALGELISVFRLDEASAVCTLRFNCQAGHSGVAIPAGTRVGTTDSHHVFVTDIDLVITAGVLTGDVSATCQDAGESANGYLAGAVSSMLDPIANVLSAANLDTTNSGTAEEDDDGMKRRIRQASDRFSTAGPRGAYRFYALGASAELVDVSVSSTPGTGVVDVYLLGKTGTPSSGALTAVAAALNDEKIRPLSDAVAVHAATALTFSITANFTLFTSADPTATMAAANASAAAYAASLKTALGLDAIDSQLLKALQVDGVYKVSLVSWADVSVPITSYASCTGITLAIVGTTDG
jgi:phage-related baseplate assembly protein